MTAEEQAEYDRLLNENMRLTDEVAATRAMLEMSHRTLVEYKDLPPILIDATTSIEDKTYWQNAAVWRQLVETGMRQDWSWTGSANRYLEVYAHATRRHQEERERLKATR